MSYCRFSSDNWRSDVYIYLGGEGWTIHIARSRHIGHIPKLPNILEVSTKQFAEAWTRQKKALEKCTLKKIDHEMAGSTHCFRTIPEAIEFLETIIKEGFNVPKYVIEDLREEK